MVDCPSIVVGDSLASRLHRVRQAVDKTPKCERGAILEATACRNHGSINGGVYLHSTLLSACPDRSSGPAGVRLTSRVVRCGCSWHQSVMSWPWTKRAARPQCRRCSTSVSPLQALEEAGSAVRHSTPLSFHLCQHCSSGMEAIFSSPPQHWTARSRTHHEIAKHGRRRQTLMPRPNKPRSSTVVRGPVHVNLLKRIFRRGQVRRTARES